jgi:DNA-binding beta-propeller fold protein YncE
MQTGTRKTSGMLHEPFKVGLAQRTYRVDRPWSQLAGKGKVTDVAIDALKRVAVLLRSDPYCDKQDDPVHLMTADGAFAGSFGSREIADAHKIAADPAGRLWVVDRDAHEIVGFDLEGRPFARLGKRHSPGMPFNHPSDIAFGADGTIVVADGYGHSKVHVFGADLTHRLSFGSIGSGPGEFMTVHGIWLCEDGRIIVADRENDRLQVFDTAGQLLAIWTGFHRPSDIWGDSAGCLYVSDGIPTLTCLAPDGRRIGRCRPVLNGAHGLTGSPDGTLYLAEGTPSRITRLVPVD